MRGRVKRTAKETHDTCIATKVGRPLLEDVGKRGTSRIVAMERKGGQDHDVADRGEIICDITKKKKSHTKGVGGAELGKHKSGK